MSKKFGKILIEGFRLRKKDNAVIVKCTAENNLNPITMADLEDVKSHVAQSCAGAKVLTDFSLSYAEKEAEAVVKAWKDFFFSIIYAKNRSAMGYFENADVELEGNVIKVLLKNDGAEFLNNMCARDAEMMVRKLFAEVKLADGSTRESGYRVVFESSLSEAEMEEFHQATAEKNDKELQDAMAKIAESVATAEAQEKNTSGEDEEEDPHIIYGNDILESPEKIVDITYEMQNTVIEGELFNVDSRVINTKNGEMTLYTAMITDKTFSYVVKVFCSHKKSKTKRSGYRDVDRLSAGLTKGAYVRVRGNLQYDSFSREDVFMATDIVKAKKKKKMDNAEVKRVELHLHTSMSDLDGVTPPGEYIKRALEWGHEAIAITDHGVVQGFAEAYRTWGRKLGGPENLKIIYGMEGYLIGENEKTNHHIMFMAKNMHGLSNLYHLVSESHLEHFSRRPRLPREVIEKYREDLIVGSACEAGELFRGITGGKSDEELLKIAEFYDYLEIQPIGNNEYMLRNGMARTREDLENFNRKVIEIGEKLSKPVVATCDVHFIDPEDEYFRRILMKGKGFDDADQQAPLYYRTTEEMLEEFKYLGDEKAYEVVVTNTRKIASMTEQIIPVQDKLQPPRMENSAEEIRELSEAKAVKLYGEPVPDIVKDRMEKELTSIIKHGFDVMYIIAQKLVKKSNDDGYLVGSRGSVGSSLVAYLSGITEVNSLQPHYRCTNEECKYSEFITDGSYECGFDLPDKVCPKCGQELLKDGYDIPFETFLGFDGDKEPDIDLNFSGEYQPRAHKYTEVLFGEGKVFRAGTVGATASKTAYGYVRKYLEEKGSRMNSAEIERLVEGCSGVKQTTGQHPGGIIVVPSDRDIHDFTPIQHPANKKDSGIITTHLDFNFLHDTLLKLDILGHKDPTTIRMLEDITGIDATKILCGESKTMSLFSSTEALGITPEDINGVDVGTLGIPEFGTGFTLQMLKDTRPTKFSELIRLSGLSHGTDVWLGNAQELIRNGTCTLSSAVCCRDDIMLYLSYAGVEPKKAFFIMEKVRKGKGLTEEDEQVMKENDVPQWYIDSCNKIKYMFPKAHAAAYVMMAFRIAWFKVYQPLAFYATWFTVRVDDFDAMTMTRGRDIAQQDAENVRNKQDKTAKEEGYLTVMDLVLEMYARGFEFLPVDLYKSHATKFQVEDGKLRPPLNSLAGLGHSAAESLYKAAAEGEFVSQEELKLRSGVSKAVIEIMDEYGCIDDMPETSQMTLF